MLMCIVKWLVVDRELLTVVSSEEVDISFDYGASRIWYPFRV